MFVTHRGARNEGCRSPAIPLGILTRRCGLIGARAGRLPELSNIGTLGSLQPAARRPQNDCNCRFEMCESAATILSRKNVDHPASLNVCAKKALNKVCFEGARL
jgi:hypothetical protein